MPADLARAAGRVVGVLRSLGGGPGDGRPRAEPGGGHPVARARPAPPSRSGSRSEPARWQSAAEAFRCGAGARSSGSADDVGGGAGGRRPPPWTSTGAIWRPSTGWPPGAAPVAGAMGVGMRVSRLQDAVAVAAALACGRSLRRLRCDGLRRQALDLMDRARTQVSGAGEVAARGAARRFARTRLQARRFWESTIRPAARRSTPATRVLDGLGLLPVAGDVADGRQRPLVSRRGPQHRTPA